MSVPLTPGQAVALGVLADWYRGRTQTLAVERHAHTGRVIVRVAGLDYELTEDGDSVLLHDEPGTVVEERRLP